MATDTAAIRPLYGSDDDPAAPSPWHPILSLPCPHRASSFVTAMQQMIEHPQHNSSWILRADILHDSARPHADDDATGDGDGNEASSVPAAYHSRLHGFSRTRTVVRRLVPRNPARDAFADQTCEFHLGITSADDEAVTLTTHTASAATTPYYLPAVQAIAFVYSPVSIAGAVSLHYRYFADSAPTERLRRTALHLLTRVVKLAGGVESGYVKRVHHDVMVPREAFQDRYLGLRTRHARRLISAWVEKTDPGKHVFEDILIAAFLIELWSQMYPAPDMFPGFVDIGCGNGVLVDILRREGYAGYGFDARRRKSWSVFDPAGEAVFEQVLVPWLLDPAASYDSPPNEGPAVAVVVQSEEGEVKRPPEGGTGTVNGIHDGRFRRGTFIVSNHADELTAWTPLLAAASASPFLCIPCCSHDLSGRRFRAPSLATQSTYASLVAYVEALAADVGWRVEREVLRIPSTRNVGIVGRHLGEGLDVREVITREGGGTGWVESVMALRKSGGKGFH